MFSSKKRKMRPVSLVINILLVLFWIFIASLIFQRCNNKNDVSVKMYGAFQYEKLTDGIVLNEYLGSEEAPEIPTEIDGKSVTSIASGCFKGNTYIKKITIPGNIWGIGIGAFKGCIQLEEVEVEEGVQMIAAYAFQNCKALKRIRLPKSMNEIGMGAFDQADEVCINTYADTVGASYAEENGIAFERRTYQETKKQTNNTNAGGF